MGASDAMSELHVSMSRGQQEERDELHQARMFLAVLRAVRSDAARWSLQNTPTCHTDQEEQARPRRWIEAEQAKPA